MKTTRGSRGFSLVEVLLALSLLFVGIVAAAPMFIFAMKETAAGADMGSVGAAAVDRMELMRASDFYTLAAGGSLSSDVSGFSDTSNSRYTVRWSIVDNDRRTDRERPCFRPRRQQGASPASARHGVDRGNA